MQRFSFAALRTYEALRFKELALAYQSANEQRAIRLRASSAPTQPEQEALVSIREIVSCGLRARAAAALRGSHSLHSVTVGKSQLPPIVHSQSALPAPATIRRRPSNIGDWSNADVCDWLKETGLPGEQVELCVQHNMSGTTLLGAPIEEICDALLIRRLGTRKRTRALVEQLRRRNLADCRAPLLSALSTSSPPSAFGLSI